MDIDYFLRTKYEENQVEGVLRTEELYKNINNTYLKHLFAVMHQNINGLLSFMQSKKNSNGHYNAIESRELLRIGAPEIHNSSYVNVARVGESTTDVTDKNEFVETGETGPVDKAGWIVRRISELGGYENVSDSVKADIFGFDIADVSGSIRLFSEVMKRLEIKLAGDELYEEFQKIYDESVGRDTGKEKAEDKMWNRGRGR